MGKNFFDQYSVLHLASGIVAYFWGITFVNWFLLHAAFELLENTKYGVQFIDNYTTLWPGGKKSMDAFINSFGDQIFAMLGWLIAAYLDNKYT